MNATPDWINHDGALLRSDVPILTASSRAFRYADGLFETMLVSNGRIRLKSHHFDRLFSGLRFLRYTIPPSLTPQTLERHVLDLCETNRHLPLARVRLCVFSGEGGPFDRIDSHPHYTIESSSLPPENTVLNPGGLIIDTFPGGRKACDELSNLKSNNYLLYALAALHAKANGLDDCLVLNSHDRIADSAIANLFYFREGRFFTPPLSEGGVAGVMRRHLLENMPTAGFPVEEAPVTVEDLLTAEEIFLTNAIRGIRWVASFRGIQYTDSLTREVCHRIIESL